MADEREVESIISGKLIRGNYESIILLGGEAQSQLRYFSKVISEILLNDNEELEYLIHDIIKEIDEFQTKSSAISKGAVLFSSKRRRRLLIKQYNSILAYIDKMTISLQLQEAQILKDSAIMGQMKKIIELALVDMEKAIVYGEEFAKKHDPIITDDSLEDWYGSLERRLEDLRISHTVLLQSQVQLNLMMENNRKLVDKILGALSGTIPIWRNQITLLLGIEKTSRAIELQEKITKVTEQYIESNSKRIRNNKKYHREIDVEKIKKVNDELAQSLTDLVTMEENNTEIRLEMRDQLI